MPLTVETDKRNLDCGEVQQSQVSSSRPFLLSSLEPCVFEALKTSLLLLRVDGSVQFASRCVHDVLGISQEEIIGKHMRDFVLREDYSRFEQCLVRLAEVQRIYDGRAAAAPSDAQAAASCVEQLSAVPQGAPGDSASQNQLLVVPEFKKQIFTCRVRRVPSCDSGPSDPRRVARSVAANSPDTQSGALRVCGETTGEYFDAEVTAFARWCSADEEVGGVENAARILGDPHKQLCLFCVLKRCLSVPQHALAAAPPQSALFGAGSFSETAATCGLQQGGPPFTSQLRPPSGTPQPQLITPGESSSLIELLTSDAGTFTFETDPQSFYQLGFGAFDSCGPPLADAYANTSLFDSVLNGVTSDVPPVGPDCFYDPPGSVQFNPSFGDVLPASATHTDLGNAPAPRCSLDPLQNGSLRFISEPADNARLKSPLAAPISRTPTPTTPSARPHGPLALAPSQLAIVPASTGRTTPQHGRPSGGSESKKLRELLLKGSTGTPAETPGDALSRSSRSCSVELPPDSVHASSVAAMRRGSLGTNASSDPVAPSPPVPRTSLSTPTPTGLPPSKLESASVSGAAFGWQKDTKSGMRSGGQQSILIQLLNTDEPTVKREAELPPNINAAAVSSTAAVTSTTTSTSRVRAKRCSVKESVSVAVPTVATGSQPAAARISATKRTASLPLEELLDSDTTSCSDAPVSAAATAITSASVSAKLAGIVQSVTHTTAYPLRGVPQPQFGAMVPRGPDQSARPSGGQTELEKLLCETSHTKSPDPPRHASGEPTTTTGPLNAPASTSAAQSQSKRAPRRTRNRSGANPNGQPQPTIVQPQPQSQPQQSAPGANNTLSKTVVKRRSTTGTIGELLSAPSPVHTGRYPPIGSVSQTSSVDQNEVANMLYDFSDTSEQMQNTRTFSDISAPLSVSSKRNSAAATLPKAAKLEIISNPDTGDDLDDSSNLASYSARSAAEGDTASGAAQYSGALMTLLTSNSPPDHFAAPRSNAAPGNTNPAWTPGTTYPPSNAGVITCEPTLASSAQRPISSHTNAALSQYVRSKQRAFSATGLQPNANEPDSAVPPQFVASPPNTVYQQLGVATPASMSAPPSDGTVEQVQSQPLASNSSVMFSRVEPFGDLGSALLFEQAPFTPVSNTFALDANGQPIAVAANGQPVLIGANGQPVPIAPYTPGPGAPPRISTLMRPPPPSYQMTTGAMQLAHPTHISDNYVSSTTSGFEVSTGLVSSTISPSQSLVIPTMRLTTPTSLQQAQVSQPPPVQRQDVLASTYPQLSPFQLTPMPSRTPQAPLTPAIAPLSDPPIRHFSPDSGISAAGASQPDDISLYLESLSTTELDLLINSVTVTLPPPPSPSTVATPNMPPPVASNSNIQFVGTGTVPFHPQYANVGTQNPHMQVQATYPIPPPSGVLSTQTPRPNAPASQFYGAAQSQVSPAVPPGSAPATPLLARAGETPNVRLPADQSALLRAAIDQSGLPPSAFGITAPQPGAMLQPTGASPRTPLASPIRRSAPNLHVPLNAGSQMLVASQATNQQHQLVNEPPAGQLMATGSDGQMVMATLGNSHVLGGPPTAQMMPPSSGGNLHLLSALNNSQVLAGTSNNGQATANHPTMLADVTHNAAQNQPDVLSGSKLAELMKATVPPNVTLPPGTHVQIPLQPGSASTGAQAPASSTRNSQAPQQLAGTGAPASQQKAGLIASQIVKEAELRQQQAAQSQAGLLQQLQARSKLQRPEQSELAAVLASPPERPSPGPTGSVTPSAFGSGAGPPPPSMFATSRPMTGSVLASLISSPVHSPVITGAPPSAFVSSASAPVLACASNSATAAATALLQPVVNPRVPNAPSRTASQPQMQPTPPNRFASPLSATPTQQSPVASSNMNANGPIQSAPTSTQPSGSSQSELTDEILETVEQLSQTHRSRLSRRSGSRSSVGETKPADPQRPPKRHDSMLERLLAENN